MYLQIEKSQLSGKISVTSSKSHTMRAILLASFARGASHIKNVLASPDTTAMITACRAFGAKIDADATSLNILGTGENIKVPDNVIDVGNSGQVLRFGAAMAARLPHYSIFTGDNSVRTLRPMQALLDALSTLGALAVSSRGDGKAPIIVRGPVRAGNIHMDGTDSQPVSAMLMLAACLPGESIIQVDNAGETPWIDLTLHWLKRLGISCQNEGYGLYRVQGKGIWQGFDYTVPSDWSSAAFPIAAALITNSNLSLCNMDINDPQGDKAVLEIFSRMGANIELAESDNVLNVYRHSGLRGVKADINNIIDALPVLAALACFASGPSTFTGAAIARQKESDRIAVISAELSKMGANITEFEDGLTVYPASLHGAVTDSHNDHRIAMALAVAALSCGNTVVQNSACVAKSFPNFASAMQSIGALIVEKDEKAG